MLTTAPDSPCNGKARIPYGWSTPSLHCIAAKRGLKAKLLLVPFVEGNIRRQNRNGGSLWFVFESLAAMEARWSDLSKLW